MNLMLYIDQKTWLHQLPAKYKLLSLAIIGSLLFTFNQLSILLPLVIIIVFLYIQAKIPFKALRQQLKPMLWIILFIFSFQFYFIGILNATEVTLRLIILILLAFLVTFTTKTSEMVNTIEAGLQPFARLGVNPSKVSLAISLAIRFLPIIAQIVTQVKEAQQTRGLDKNILALVVPVMIRTLKLSDDIADAIDSRTFTIRD